MPRLPRLFPSDLLGRHRASKQVPIVAEIVDARVERNVDEHGNVTYKHIVPVFVYVKDRKKVLIAGRSEDPAVRYFKPDNRETDVDAFFEYDYKPGAASDNKKEPKFTIEHRGQATGCPVLPHSVESRVFLTDYIDQNSTERYGYGDPENVQASTFSCE